MGVVSAKECSGKTCAKKSRGLEMVQIRSGLAREHHGLEMDLEKEEEECEMSSIAKDYYYKPPEHEFICHRRGKPDLDLEVGSVQHFHPVTGDTMTIRGRALGRGKFQVDSFTPRGRAKPQRASFLQSVESMELETRTAAVLMIRFLEPWGVEKALVFWASSSLLAEDQLGWLTPSLELSNSNFAGQLTDVPLRSMSVYDDGAITVTGDWAATADVYWIQLKTQHHYDSYMKSGWYNNVQIKKWNKGSYEISWHLKTLNAGESWTSDDGELTVTVQSIDVVNTMTALLTLSRPTTTTTTTLVIDSDRHVFLDVFADWCGPCVQAKPHFYKLASLLRACDDIGICSYDADANEKPAKYIPESHIPVFKLFVRGDKQNPISFKGERTLRGFLSFLKQHTKLDIQDALRLLYADYCSQNNVEELYRQFLSSLAAQMEKNQEQLPSHLLRWAEQYFMDPERFYPTKDDPGWERSGTPQELLGQVGTVVSSESSFNEIQVQFPPELVVPMRSQQRRGWQARQMQMLEKQGIVMLHRQALEIEAEVVSAAPRKKSKWLEVWEKVPPVEKDRLHEVVVRMDLQLMIPGLKGALNAQPGDPRQFLVRAITEGNPLTISTVYPRFLSETRPERVAVKAPKALSKQEANEAWTDLEKALFLPDIFGVLGSGGDESRLLPLKQLLIRGLQPDFSFRGRPLLHRACESGDLALAELLFACGADLHARGGDEESLPIEVAAWCGQMQLLRLLLMNGSCFGQALHMATLAGHLEAVQLLLNYGCPPHVRIAGVSPLDLAIAACQAPIVNLLLQQPMLLDTGGAEERLHSQGIGRFGLAPRSRRLHLCCKLGGPRGAER
eukprot:g19630.t1